MHTSIRFFTSFSIVLLAACSVVTAAAAEPEKQHGGLMPIRFRKIELGGFWKQQIKLQCEQWIPHCIEQMEQGGQGRELVNLIETGKVLRGEPHEKYTGRPWSDAYIYNTVEAACLALEVDPGSDAELAAAQEFLRRTIERWIPIILAAQAPDGYIHSYHTVNGHPRFSNIAAHEFYVMGYLFEMSIAHFRMTAGQDRRLYDAALRCADMLCAMFGPSPKRTWKNGHAGMEHALCRLGVLVNEVQGAGQGTKYIELARHFMDHQYELKPNVYDQSEKPAVTMTEARGHAVRATYFYTAMADLALLQKNAAYGAAADLIWANAIHKKHYLTGGVGALHSGEAFGGDFELPNNGYCESCASCGLSFWAEQMQRRHADAHYVDVQERALYNNVLGAIELSGKNFYYQNPLTSNLKRYPWHACPCCVGNIPRTLIAIKDLMYSTSTQRNTLYINHFVESKGSIPAIGGTALLMQQETLYPWQGEVRLTLTPAAPATFTLAVRIPEQCESKLYSAEPDLTGGFTLSVNGEKQALNVSQGYARLQREWKAGDQVAIFIPLAVQRVRCDARVAANLGRVALQRGPLTYTFEDLDNPTPARRIILKPEVELKAQWHPKLLGGVMTIQGGGLTAVPNFARLNRGGASQVWVLEDLEQAGMNTLTGQAELSVSFCRDNMSTDAINDQILPKDAHDGSPPNFDFWPHKGSAEWIQYDFAAPATVTRCILYWFDDTGSGECRLPASWRIVYRSVDGGWEPVKGVEGYPVAKRTPVEVSFTPVTTSALRLEVQLPEKFSAGVYEWIVH